MMDMFIQNLRYAIRTLRRTPGFTLLAVVTLALGIGANSAMFTVVKGVIIEPLDYPDPDRLVVIFSTFPGLGLSVKPNPRGTVSPAEYRELQARSRVFSAMGSWRVHEGDEANLSGIETPRRVTAATVSAEFFAALGILPQFGRVFTGEEETSGGEAVAVISDRLWRGAFGPIQISSDGASIWMV